jgi:hypothetical protein
MGVLDTIRDGLDTAWTSLGDLKQVVTIRRITRGVYNPATGTTTDNVVTATPLCILSGYKADLIDGTDIRVGDLQCIIRGKDIDFRPEQGDSVTLPNGQVWRVMRATGDLYSPPIYHELMLRR